MRRAQTTRSANHGRQSSISASPSDDFGILRRDSNSNSRTSFDGGSTSGPPHAQSSLYRRQREPGTGVLDLSTKLEVDEPEEGEDDTTNMGIGTMVAEELRKELREAQKEIERLANMITALQGQLSQRPPLAKVQAVEKEYNQLDLLYHSTQRENQACMAEIEKGKRRERILEGELAKLVGDGWMDHLGLTAQLNPNITAATTGHAQNSPIMSTRSAIGASQRRPSVSRGLSTSSSAGDSSTVSRQPPVPSLPSSSVASGTSKGQSTNAATMEHFEQIRALILGMDEKMRLNNEKLEGMMASARAEEKKYESLASASLAGMAAVSSGSGS
ncbi:hypothetical protein FRB94_009377 [Tulasnella sp. JGI-2019a]|nr:hypothetical protein FRB93_008744 [Tulasnella sp. JGI-2019a]KAG8995160.1 hypothetical protein FRB94_009377 [Tulasnella sp. JGI-2019a]